MVTKRQISPVKKTISAIYSYLFPFAELFLKERKEKILLHINSMAATEVHSSIKVVPFNFNIFNEVKTRKQMPGKLAEVFKMCGALLLL